jgi:cytoskeletal protein CcmA (bactofilin family)
MSIYPSPKLHNGSLNTIFNNTDYIKVASGGGSTIAQTDARYLQNSGVVVSSANTTFNGTLNVGALTTVDGLVAGNIDTSNINVSGSATVNSLSTTGVLTAGNISASNINISALANVKDIKVSGLLSGDVSGENISVSALATVKDLNVKGSLTAKQSSDTLTSDIFRADQLYSFSNGMVYTIISDATTVNSVSFINIPTTTNQTYIFTFILQPSAVNSPYYIKPSSNTIVVNNVSVPLYGLSNVVLPSSYTYLVQQISIIYDIYAGGNFFALTSVSAY